MKPEQNFMGKFTIETGAETVGRKLQTEIQLLSGGDSSTTDAEFGFSHPTYAEFGFSRLDFRQSPLSGTVQFYERHVFLWSGLPRSRLRSSIASQGFYPLISEPGRAR